jgi:hypothetical protein
LLSVLLIGAEASAQQRSVLVVGSTDAYRHSFVSQFQEQRGFESNLRFLQSAIEAFSLDPRLMKIGNRPPRMRVVREGGKARWDALESSVLESLKAHVDAAKDASAPSSALRDLARRTVAELQAELESRYPNAVPEVTLSDVSKELVGELKDVVRIVHYRSQEMPLPVLESAQTATALVKALASVSDGRIRYEVVDPDRYVDETATKRAMAYLEALKAGKPPREPAPADLGIPEIFGRQELKSDEERRVERQREAASVAAETSRDVGEVLAEMLHGEFREELQSELGRRGVSPFSAAESVGNVERESRFFNHVLLEYLDREPAVLPAIGASERLEYELVREIVSLCSDEKSVIALIDGSRATTQAGATPLNPGLGAQAVPPFASIVNFVGQSFRLREFGRRDGSDFAEFSSDESLRAIWLLAPHKLDPVVVAAIRKAVARGVPALIIISRYTFDASPQGLGRGVPVGTFEPGDELLALLAEWGVALGEGVVGSNDCGTVQLAVGLGERSIRAPAPFQGLPQGDLGAAAERSSLVGSLEHLLFPAASPLVLDSAKLKAAGFEAEVLARSPPKSWIAMLRAPDEVKLPEGVPMTLKTHAPSLLRFAAEPKTSGLLEKPVPIVVFLRGAVSP